jgi:hypothetical protein
MRTLFPKASSVSLLAVTANKSREEAEKKPKDEVLMLGKDSGVTSGLRGVVEERTGGGMVFDAGMSG